jgi:ubiquinone/menaquinone biosynthesis C-methylase UbiE
MAAPQTIRFEDGAAYERLMGTWSRSAGQIFLDWLNPARGLDWVDVGCGNGAFSDLILDRCAPASVQGVDPSEGQLAFARTRTAGKAVRFQQAGAEALPFGDASFDVATMALVIFFVPNPAKGVAEMVRTVRPGGLVASYGWDLLGGGFPLDPLQRELRAMDLPVTMPPSPEMGSADVVRKLWQDAGLDRVETTEIKVTRDFADFEEFWATALLSPSAGPGIAKFTPEQVARLKEGVRARLPIAGEGGRITVSARANAVKGFKRK